MNTQIAIVISISVFAKMLAKTSPIAAGQAVVLTDIATWANANVLEMDFHFQSGNVQTFAQTHQKVGVEKMKSVYRMEMAVSSVNADQISTELMANALSVQGLRDKEDWLINTKKSLSHMKPISTQVSLVQENIPHLIDW